MQHPFCFVLGSAIFQVAAGKSLNAPDAERVSHTLAQRNRARSRVPPVPKMQSNKFMKKVTDKTCTDNISNILNILNLREDASEIFQAQAQKRGNHVRIARPSV